MKPMEEGKEVKLGGRPDHNHNHVGDAEEEEETNTDRHLKFRSISEEISWNKKERGDRPTDRAQCTESREKKEEEEEGKIDGWRRRCLVQCKNAPKHTKRKS